MVSPVITSTIFGSVPSSPVSEILPMVCTRVVCIPSCARRLPHCMCNRGTLGHTIGAKPFRSFIHSFGHAPSRAPPAPERKGGTLVHVHVVRTRRLGPKGPRSRPRRVCEVALTIEINTFTCSLQSSPHAQDQTRYHTVLAHCDHATARRHPVYKYRPSVQITAMTTAYTPGSWRTDKVTRVQVTGPVGSGRRKPCTPSKASCSSRNKSSVASKGEGGEGGASGGGSSASGNMLSPAAAG